MTGPRVSSAERLGLVLDAPQLEAEVGRQRVGSMVNDLDRGAGNVESARDLLAELEDASRRAGTRGPERARFEASALELRGAIDRRTSRDTIARAPMAPTRRSRSRGQNLTGALRRMESRGPGAAVAPLVRGRDAFQQLARTDLSQLQSRLTEAGFDGAQSEQFMDALKTNLAVRFNERLTDFVADELEGAADEMDQASLGMGRRFDELQATLEGVGGQRFLTELRAAGHTAAAQQLSHLLDDYQTHALDRTAFRELARPVLARTAAQLSDALRAGAQAVRENHGNGLTGSIRRAFPGAAEKLSERLGLDPEAASGHATRSDVASTLLSDAFRTQDQEYAEAEASGQLALVAAGIVATAVSGGASLLVTVGTASARESITTGADFEGSRTRGLASVAGLEDPREAIEEQAREDAQVAMSVAAVAAEALASGPMHNGMHALEHLAAPKAMLPSVLARATQVGAQGARVAEAGIPFLHHIAAHAVDGDH